MVNYEETCVFMVSDTIYQIAYLFWALSLQAGLFNLSSMSLLIIQLEVHQHQIPGNSKQVPGSLFPSGNLTSDVTVNKPKPSTYEVTPLRKHLRSITVTNFSQIPAR